MCEPTTIAMGLMLVGGAVSGGSMIQQGKQAAYIADQQAELMQQQALREQDAAEIEADKVARAHGALQGRQLVTAAANNQDLGGELVQDLLQETELSRKFETNMIYVNARNRAQGLAFEAANVKHQGRQQRSASYLAAASTLLQTGSAAAQTYGYMRRPSTVPTVATGG